MKHFNIAIDGPTGVGKSIIAKLVTKKLGSVYVDTGAIYRTMVLHFLRKGIDPADEASIAEACRDVDVTIRYEDGAQQVILDRENVLGLIRTEEVGSMASTTSVYMSVREKLVELQQELVRKTDAIMDGRDIGTCVLPDALTKIYLTASVDIGAKRRYGELVEKGVECDLESIAEDIKERGRRDINREHSPLKQAEDAVLPDSSFMTTSQVAGTIIAIAREHGLEV